MSKSNAATAANVHDMHDARDDNDALNERDDNAPDAPDASEDALDDAPDAPQDVMEREIAGHDVALPVKFRVGHRTNVNETANLNRLYADRFTSNIRSDVERRGKVYTPDELVAKWNDYVLGAPRTGTGETLREQAALQFLREHLASLGSRMPTVGRRAKDESDDAYEARKAAVDAEVEKMLARVYASTNPATIARLEAITNDLREKRKLAQTAKLPAATTDTLADI